MRFQLTRNKSTTDAGTKWCLTVALGIVVVAMGVWFGEDLTSGVPSAAILLAVVSGLLVYLVSPYPSLAGTLCVASIVLICAAAGWYMGRTTATSAFNDCIERGEMVRVALQQYQERHGAFPGDLSELRPFDLPGQRWFRGSLLTYRRTPSGYELNFSDWLVTHGATEAQAFASEK